MRVNTGISDVPAGLGIVRCACLPPSSQKLGTKDLFSHAAKNDDVLCESHKWALQSWGFLVIHLASNDWNQPLRKPIECQSAKHTCQNKHKLRTSCKIKGANRESKRPISGIKPESSSCFALHHPSLSNCFPPRKPTVERSQEPVTRDKREAVYLSGLLKHVCVGHNHIPCLETAA